ncbi:MAG: TetR/AcrR family transcriptional regulator [Rhodothalassiaceae bacterium]
MARPREFDMDEALEGAMQTFWARGYRATALPDLLAGMGLSRGSLYKAFGDKKRVFLDALARYDRQAVEASLATLTDPAEPNGAHRIARLFDAIVAGVRAGDRRGCLLCNTAAGAAADDAEIAMRVQAMMTRLTRGFEAALADLPPDQALTPAQCRERARGLTAAYIGLRVLARAGTEPAVLQDIGRSALDQAVA